MCGTTLSLLWMYLSRNPAETPSHATHIHPQRHQIRHRVIHTYECDIVEVYVWHDSLSQPDFRLVIDGEPKSSKCVLWDWRQHIVSLELTHKVLQRVAVCCSVLQCVAVCCSVLQCVAVCCSVLQCVAVCCTICCRQSRYVDVNLITRIFWDWRQRLPCRPHDMLTSISRCNTLQHTATHCNTLQHAATLCVSAGF